MVCAASIVRSTEYGLGYEKCDKKNYGIDIGSETGSKDVRFIHRTRLGQCQYDSDEDEDEDYDVGGSMTAANMLQHYVLQDQGVTDFRPIMFTYYWSTALLVRGAGASVAVSLR